MVYTQYGQDTESLNKVAEELQPLLAELIDLSLQGKQAHWNVVGPHFSAVHSQLDRIVDDARKWADEVAERLVTIGVPAAGQLADVERRSSLQPLPQGTISDERVLSLISGQLAAVAAHAREALDRLGNVDLVSQDLVIEIAGGLEKHNWMLRVQQS
jgi:starvation-inducible DNA-binding protein